MSFPVGIKKTETRSSLQRRLIKTMAILLGILALLIVGGLFLFRQISMPGKDMSEALQLQEAFFANSMESYFNSLTAMTVHMGEEASYVIELQDKQEEQSQEKITELEQKLLPVLRENLLQADCSGGFILLNTGSSGSLPGLYIKKDIHHVSSPELFLYRGMATVAQDAGMSLHSKWHTLMNPSAIPDYSDLLVSAETKSIDEDVHLSRMTVLAGTDDRVVYLTCPLKGSDGTVYGIAGFEISARYFRAANEQPTRLSRLICVLIQDGVNQFSGEDALYCGYHYVTPGGILNIDSETNSLMTIHAPDEGQDYVGVREQLNLSYANTALSLIVMIPKADYDDAVATAVRQIIILFLLVLLAAAGCCWYFSELYLKPIRASLRYMSESNYEEAKAGIHELDDLSSLLAEKNSQHENALQALTQKKKDAEKKVSRLAFDRKKEIDPQFYEQFREGLKTLTATECQVLNLVADGKSTRDILNELCISENTLKFHIKNIYSKLNVHSRKQAAMYLAVYRHEEEHY